MPCEMRDLADGLWLWRAVVFILKPDHVRDVDLARWSWRPMTHTED
jgi:hypothetical protein